jgi:hydroxymethylpyrimidine/phosphomethylpyrimidine kinase
MSAVTAITAQNTVEVSDIHVIPPETIIAQVRAVASDIGVDAVKIGMLGTVPTIEAVDRALEELKGGPPVVLDPVMVAESGAHLLEPEAREALVKLLLPRAMVATPNLAEARTLAGSRDASAADLARAVLALGPAVVVVTGGHADATDAFFDGEALVELSGERHADGASHGSGCTHSSTLAALLAWGLSPLEAARGAKVLAAAAVERGLAGLGAGAGPVDVLGLPERAPPLT